MVKECTYISEVQCSSANEREVYWQCHLMLADRPACHSSLMQHGTASPHCTVNKYGRQKSASNTH